MSFIISFTKISMIIHEVLLAVHKDTFKLVKVFIFAPFSLKVSGYVANSKEDKFIQKKNPNL